MRRQLALVGLILSLAVAAGAGEFGSRAMSGWFNVTTPEGWTGRRYMDGNEIFAEEFDSTGDGRIDIWRFYRRGMLSSEERDLDGDGRVDFQSRWEPREKRLLSVLRDTDRRGVNDLEIESPNLRQWEIREDRNRDGIADRILFLHGPPDLFEQLGIDVARERNVIEAIPMTHWRELWLDDGYTTSITDYRRYYRGSLTHTGDWDGRKVVWVRRPADYLPPPATAPIAATGQAPLPPADPSAAGVYTDHATAATDPFTDPFADPYAATTPTYSEPYTDPTYLEPPATLGTPPPLRDRTRYEGLPPGESAAGSLPARMRPPGVGRR